MKRDCVQLYGHITDVFDFWGSSADTCIGLDNINKVFYKRWTLLSLLKLYGNIIIGTCSRIQSSRSPSKSNSVLLSTNETHKNCQLCFSFISLFPSPSFIQSSHPFHPNTSSREDPALQPVSQVSLTHPNFLLYPLTPLLLITLLHI